MQANKGLCFGVAMFVCEDCSFLLGLLSPTLSFLPFLKPPPSDRIAGFRIVFEIETTLPVADPDPVGVVNISSVSKHKGKLAT